MQFGVVDVGDVTPDPSRVRTPGSRAEAVNQHEHKRLVVAAVMEEVA